MCGNKRDNAAYCRCHFPYARKKRAADNKERTECGSNTGDLDDRFLRAVAHVPELLRNVLDNFNALLDIRNQHVAKFSTDILKLMFHLCHRTFGRVEHDIGNLFCRAGRIGNDSVKSFVLLFGRVDDSEHSGQGARACKSSGEACFFYVNTFPVSID